MNAETWFVENYVQGLLPVPGAVMQAVLNTYLQTYHWLEPYIGRPGARIPEQTEEIAARSQELMETHYNMPASMFTSFLGRTMKYSMALWESGDQTLDDAQDAMLADVCAKADIRDGHKILDPPDKPG